MESSIDDWQDLHNRSRFQDKKEWARRPSMPYSMKRSMGYLSQRGGDSKGSSCKGNRTLTKRPCLAMAICSSP